MYEVSSAPLNRRVLGSLGCIIITAQVTKAARATWVARAALPTRPGQHRQSHDGAACAVLCPPVLSCAELRLPCAWMHSVCAKSVQRLCLAPTCSMGSAGEEMRFFVFYCSSLITLWQAYLYLTCFTKVRLVDFILCHDCTSAAWPVDPRFRHQLRVASALCANEHNDIEATGCHYR